MDKMMGVHFHFAFVVQFHFALDTILIYFFSMSYSNN